MSAIPVAVLPRPSRLEGAVGAAAAFAAFAVPFAAYTGFILYHFYVKGSFVLDSGWAAYLISHGGLRLPYPRVLGGETDFIHHVPPIFIALALIRRALPVSDIQFFAGFIGLCHALPALGVFWILHSGYRLRSAVALPVAVLIAVAFSFNGLALAIVRYPHTEMLIVGGAILFFIALLRRQLLAAGVFLILALTTREDAGFHLFGILFVLMAVNRWYGIAWRAQRAEMTFAAVALAYSAAAFAMQQAMFHGTATSTLTITYLGDPPFAALTVAKLAQRLLFYLAFRGYVILPALVAALWAVRTRNPYIVVGYIAFLPWGLLQLLAHSDIAGTLSGYYAYPFMIASFWPLLGVLLDRRRRGVEGGAAVPVLAFSAMLAASFVGVGQQYNPGGLALADFLSPPSLARQARTERAVAALVRSKPALGRFVAGTGVVALAPDDFAPDETWPFRGSVGPADTVVYFVHGYDAGKARRLAAACSLDRRYRVRGTSIRIATDRPIAASAPIAALLVPAGGPGANGGTGPASAVSRLSAARDRFYRGSDAP